MYSLKRMVAKLAGGVSTKTLAIILALTMALASAATGTLAWMYATAPQVKNTFTYGQLDITLTETDTGLDDDGNPDTNQYQMDVGAAIHKDPTITVAGGSVDGWLFVQLTESVNFADVMAFTMADGWLPMPGTDGLYYRPFDASEDDQIFPVLKDDQVQMNPSVTLADLAALTSESYPTLTVTAYAVQRGGSAEISTPGAAWQIIQGEIN